MCYSLGDRELKVEARKQREDETRRWGQKADSARWAEGKEKALTEEVWELVSGVG
jgi:hypothetical protein